MNTLSITYKKAKDMLDERARRAKQFELVLSAGMCPECGEDLVLKTKRWTTKVSRGIIFKKEVGVPHIYHYFGCPKGHELINPQGYDRRNPGCCEYNGLKSPNKVIRDYWLKHFSCDDEEE